MRSQAKIMSSLPDPFLDSSVGYYLHEVKEVESKTSQTQVDKEFLLEYGPPPKKEFFHAGLADLFEKNLYPLLSLKDLGALRKVNTFFNSEAKEALNSAKIDRDKKIADLFLLSPGKLSAEGISSEETAMLIVHTQALYEKLGSYNSQLHFRLTESAALHRVSTNQDYICLASGSYLSDLGLAHSNVAKYILENNKLKERINPYDVGRLKDVIASQNRASFHGHFTL